MLFEELKKRLALPKTVAIWRILPSVKSGLAAVTEAEVENRGGYWTERGKYATWISMIVDKFLQTQKVTAKPIVEEELIFLIEGATVIQKDRGQDPFADQLVDGAL